VNFEEIEKKLKQELEQENYQYTTLYWVSIYANLLEKHKTV
jgi:hypothetical protein